MPLNVHFDNLHLQRDLVNLMSNAIEGSERGQEVKVGSDIKEDFLRITIRDDGSSMDKEALGNIFIPSFTKKKRRDRPWHADSEKDY